ncbi:MAG: insulinase family protein, partial [Planctomycetaceae bacterium]
MQRSFSPLLLTALVGLTAGFHPWSACGQQVTVEEVTLENGMQFLLIPRNDQPNVVSAGWVARVGSVNERPGITGISHFFDHMMVKGTDTLGTRAPERDARYRVD